MFKELYPSDFTSLTFEKAIQKIPFQSQTKLAIEEMGREIIRLKDEISIYTWTKKGNGSYLIHVSFEKKKLVVHHFLSLFPKEEKETGYRILSQLAKMYRMEEIILKTPKRFIEMEDILKTEKYVYVEDIGYVAKVEYCTGLVLGGGGAKGAYQIGVWHALEEMAIEYQMISGTSVGALNGSLILQGDLQVAENMWESITTDKILSISTQEEEIEYTMNHFLKSWQELTLLAIQSKGISTEPLLDLIERLMRPDVIFSREIDFYVVTTIMSTMEEKVISLNEMTKDDFPHWLLASSSFYPAMMPCFIDGVYYIDGGYRNNIPKDVLVNRGATEIIVVDVSGPGLSKSFKPPETIVETDLKSSWGLGSMLLFDGNRASWNMVLGYLETKKIFGCFSGNDYTFKKKEFKKDCLNLSREFFTFLKTVHPFVEWYDKKTTLKIWEWLIKNNERPETISLLLLESLGKKLDISPIEVYSVESLGEAIQINWCNEENREEESLSDNMLKSLGEWLSVYMREKLPFSDHQLLRYYYSYFNSEEPKNKELFTVLMEVSWMSGLEALFLLFLEKRNV